MMARSGYNALFINAAPTGKSFKLTVATLGHWTPVGVMEEEYLFWDNLAFMKQISIAQ
ncbi:hypothetical protein [Phyllobacterium endophyticum]|uniref:hypothetical protein n=1 Tax=Phyllobacterium endophyticum TaxID=1149773 RepID=UPI001474F836|nr:hypothetical protein [Phyllobacterium endophyticum]MBB3234165.1 hypothetical protein [Phyllobacterium endophyticum]